MKERYVIIKKIYPDYLILFKEKENIKYVGIDKEIMKYFKQDNLKNVNKILLNNLNIEDKEEYTNNLYDIYYIKAKIINWLKGIVI